ncbi:MAG: sodium/glutamate symporter [Simplicispira suum]|uniref:sodium/glutamate symporter n=1 Tax=Simplicispira suum TaxID=2109915 RepID=UPI001C6AC81F|nr:sodium/glutamate symporter [Simplicispira suum]MBW7834805.1 sodium/glutamate symporter [Simplicispira suum]
MDIELNAYYTMILATLVLLLGRLLIVKIKFLADFNIPEPVAGGLLAGVIVFVLNALFGLTFQFSTPLQTGFMLMFFSSIGLGADFARLKAGGKPLAVFLVVVAGFIVVQDVVGVGLAAALGLDPLIGLVAGSITLTGGHGTAGAWGPVLEAQYGIVGATTLGIATATFGLVAGGLIGGPVAKRLLKKIDHQRLAPIGQQTPVEAVAASQSLYSTRHTEAGDAPDSAMFDKPDEIRLITASSTIETLALFAACLAFADLMTIAAKGTAFELPTFVWALAGGVVIRNVLTTFFNFEMFDRAIDVFGNASLSLFLAMALLSLRLWELTELALPVMVILLAQVGVMMLYASFVTFRVMGANYDAAVLAGGHCGFGMGATPTAIANMQAITDRYGPSYKAFLIVPMVGAFFVDLVNAAVLQFFTQLPFLQ